MLYNDTYVYDLCIPRYLTIIIIYIIIVPILYVYMIAAVGRVAQRRAHFYRWSSDRAEESI